MIFEGTAAMVEDQLSEFLLLQSDIKWMTARLDELKGHLKERGSFSTRNYVVAVMDQSRTGMAPLDQVLKAIDRQSLEALGLIQTTTYKVVKVSKK